ncbi:MAG: hypothetical protein RPU14_03835 [Candidatus Sedimenticola sp. (ex Thyasira tokunagai)]
MPNLNDITKEKALSYLPEIFVEEVGHVLSLEGIIWLIENFGGTGVNIPKHSATAKNRFHGLSNSDIEGLCHQFSGTSLSVPIGANLLRFIRNCSIMKMRDEGLSAHVIARRHKMTERNVWLIIRSCAAA